MMGLGGFFRIGDRLMSVTAAHVVDHMPRDHFCKVNDEDVAFIEVGSSVESVFNPLYIEPDRGTFDSFCFPSVFPFDPNFLQSLEPGTKIIKLGSRTGLTEGRLLRIADSVTYWEKAQKFEVKNCVSVAWRSDERFTSPGDSGSVYYAVRGCFRYPIAVHRASLVIKGRSEDTIEDENGMPVKIDPHYRISIGTPLAICLDWFAEVFNLRKRALDYTGFQEDEFTLPRWIARFDRVSPVVSAASLQKASDGVIGSEEDVAEGCSVDDM